MPLTLTHAILGVICSCILFGNSSVNAESDGLQPGQDRELAGLSEGPPETTTAAPRVMRFPKRNNYPVKNKGGVLYFDLAGVNQTKVKVIGRPQKENITGTPQEVKRITASHGDCKIQSLLVDSNYILDEELITNCPNLNLTLKGERWRCLHEGLMLHRREVKVNMTMAKCMDTWYNNDENIKAKRYPMAEGIQKLLDFNITYCPVKMCICRWYFINDSFTISLDCDQIGLTDDNLPALPDTVTTLYLSRNNLSSMESLVKYLEPHHLRLHELRLDYNLFEELPRFANGTFPKIEHLSINSNKIVEIDIEIFRELITGRNLDVSLAGNHFTCDCNLYNFKVFLLKRYLRQWKSFKTYMNMDCHIKGQTKTMKMHDLSEGLCMTWRDRLHPDTGWWILNLFLGALNVLVIVLIVDLAFILKRVGCDRTRVPLMARLLSRVGIASHQTLQTFDATGDRDSL